MGHRRKELMKRTAIAVLLLGFWSQGQAAAQVATYPAGASALPTGDRESVVTPTGRETRSVSSCDARTLLPLPVLPAEQAMARFQRRSASQATELTSYSSVSVIHAELPDTSRQAEYELQSTFTAPRTLLFTPIRFMGDRFVKISIITRLLQSEVDHVEKNDFSRTAISGANYRFAYQGKNEIAGRVAHIFQVKPYKKRPGLFKGRIYLDVHTGSLLRTEGRIVRSPSLFVKHIEFVQDYTDIGSFTLPVHIHTEARAFFVGRVIIDIRHSNYEPIPVYVEANLIQLSGWTH
jgi:hypothetical protein